MTSMRSRESCLSDASFSLIGSLAERGVRVLSPATQANVMRAADAADDFNEERAVLTRLSRRRVISRRRLSLFPSAW